MPTYTALTTLEGAQRAEALGARLEALSPAPEGVGVFELEDGSGLWEVGGYFTAKPDEIALALLAAAHGARAFAVSELPETDWVAKVRRELAPISAGRFFLYGAHDAHRVPEGRVGLLIEASMAFGTGHHGTTLGCLLALDGQAVEGPPPRRVADIGCGTAVLAMAAARVWRGEVVAADIDPVAVEVARANLAANGLEGRIACLQAAGFQHPEIAARAPFDLILANILKSPLVDLAPEMARHCASGGRLILSGLLIDQAAEVAAVYAKWGFAEVARREIDGWATLSLDRASDSSPRR